ncbi:hypothetical protein ZHAS_00015920 [Anopheles sinensis]|uniref:PHD-type domain-containing protein n=1 Tax=Anopheles sinensis TaxID=74873 RepID=A0A084WCC3_ANOSI|nr:hypothetical protein ZHAS_00015920 [Anopheles sinensis]
MDPEQIILDNNDFDDGSDYGEYEFMQDQDALSLNAPLDAILDPTTTPISCQSSPIEDSLALSANLEEQPAASSVGIRAATVEASTIRTVASSSASQQQQQQQQRPTQKLTIKTIILGSPAVVTTASGGGGHGSSSSSSSSSSPSSSSPSSSVPSPASSIGVRYGLGGGKPSAAALRRGPGRPKKDFIPLLKMSSGSGGSSSSFASGGTTTTTTAATTATMVKVSGGAGIAATAASGTTSASVGVGGSSPSSESKIVKRKAELAVISLNDSTTNPSAAMANARSPPSSTLAAPLSSPPGVTGGFGSLLSSPNDDGGTLGGGTANSSVASTPTAEIDADPALLMPAPDEMPYFPEKYPGKVCILCNLGERSQLGQGEMLRIEMTLAADQIASALSQDEKAVASGLGIADPSGALGDIFGDKSPKASGLGPPQFGGSKRQKGSNKCKNPIANAEYTDELEKIGHLEVIDSSISDGGYFYIHRSCALWSYGVGRDPVSGTLSNLEVVVVQSLSRRCHFCAHYGASLSCKMSCPKWYHFPCVAASGGFQVIQTYNIFCKEHLGQVPLVCAEDINCRQCSALGDVGNLVMCSICGDHYHGTCVGLAQLPGVRTGWQCNSCKKCQICRVPDSSEGRSVACELCDKIYHASCLRPIMTSIPKLGWKCRCCRVCSDCGARTPGAGASSRWHSHYTVCDSCYQQRNKGFSCPICHRAYRAAAHREMVKCSVCYKFVHSTCDPDADLSTYHSRKEANPEYEYLCAPCKTVLHNGRLAAALRRSSGSVDDDSMSLSQDSLNDDAMEVDSCGAGSEAGRDSIRERFERSGTSDVGLGKGKPYVASKIAKKRLGLTLSGVLGNNRPKGIGKGFQKKNRLADITRKRGSKAKMRGIFGVPGLGLQRPTADLVATTKSSEEEPGGENRLVLCSAKDKFVLTQDICVMCGAIGTDQEGCLIACTQCGQCYHPYCTNVKVTKVILQKGWRCLDCTICEGCGQRNDEARLILCDDCDISYHIYCMDPPLEHVPQGTWKCKWCAMCLKCGTNSPGYNCSWMNSYTECGPCASQSNCPSCNEGYADGELIIQCHQCERWLHSACDQIKNEAEAERCAEEGYNCLLCRPGDQPPPHLVPKRRFPSVTIAPIPPVPTPKSASKLEERIVPLALEGNHYLDGVCLSEHGLHQIKALQAEFGKRGKRKPKLPAEPPPAPGKDAAILAAIESVVAGSSHDNSLEGLEPLDPKEEAEIYKDGMVWNDPTPPEGFALFTTESGTVVLRKKRQRNLQKLGIGGFFVRNRGVRTKDGKDDEDLVDGALDEDGATGGATKPKKKPIRRKPKSKLIEIYPNILQDAFFGRSLLSASMPTFDFVASDDDVKSDVSDDKTVKLSAEELKLFEAVKTKEEEINNQMSNEQSAGVLAVPSTAGQLVKNQPIAGQPTKQQGGGRRTPSAAAQVHPSTTEGGNVASSTVATNMSSNGAANVVAGCASSGSAAPGSATSVGGPTKMEEDDNSDTEALKDVLGLPTDFNEEEFVSQIMNDDELTKNSSAFDDLTTGTELGESLAKASKDELDILSPHFDLANFGQMDSKVVEEIFKTVLTDESQESQESMLAGSMTPYTSNTSTPSHSTDVTKKAVNTRYIAPGAVQPMMQQSSQQQPLQEHPTHLHNPSQQPQLQVQQQQAQQHRQLPAGMVLTQSVQSAGMTGQQVMLNEQAHAAATGGSMGMQPNPSPQMTNAMGGMAPTHIPQSVHGQSNIMVSSSIPPDVNQQQQHMNRGAMMGGYQDPSQCQSPVTVTSQPPMQQSGQWQNQNIPLVAGAGPIDTSPGTLARTTTLPPGTAAASATGEMVGTLDETNMKSAQKLSEKMRKDEMLGDMATISSVLYCNMRHPELKTEFPNWNERWKQISKRWRLLSNEDKQPFLQHARDNRSASKMKKTQQVPQLSPKDGNSNSSGMMNIVGPSSASSPSCSSSSNISGSLTTETGSIAIRDSNTTPSSSNDTNTNASIDSVNGDGSKPHISNTHTTTRSETLKNTTITTTAAAATTSSSTDRNTGNASASISEASQRRTLLNPLLSISDNATSNLIVRPPSASAVDQQPSQVDSPQASSVPAGTGTGGTKANLVVAANIANTFINLSSLTAMGQTASPAATVPQTTIPVTQRQPPYQQPGTDHPHHHAPGSVNVLVNQSIPPTHVMKTLAIGNGRANIFVPNVIASNVSSPHFTVHHHHHHQFGPRNGPAPNVTVNPNGNFNTNSSAVLRPGYAHIRPTFLPQSFNILGNTVAAATTAGGGSGGAIQSPILAASLQTINKIAAQQQSLQTQQQQQQQQPQHSRPANVNKIINVGPDGSQKILITTAGHQLLGHQSPQQLGSPQRPRTPSVLNTGVTPSVTMMNLNDQQIRVLTPCEIMRTLPSLDGVGTYEMMVPAAGKSVSAPQSPHFTVLSSTMPGGVEAKHDTTGNQTSATKNASSLTKPDGGSSDTVALNGSNVGSPNSGVDGGTTNGCLPNIYPFDGYDS